MRTFNMLKAANLWETWFQTTSPSVHGGPPYHRPRLRSLSQRCSPSQPLRQIQHQRCWMHQKWSSCCLNQRGWSWSCFAHLHHLHQNSFEWLTPETARVLDLTCTGHLKMTALPARTCECWSACIDLHTIIAVPPPPRRHCLWNKLHPSQSFRFHAKEAWHAWLGKKNKNQSIFEPHQHSQVPHLFGWPTWPQAIKDMAVAKIGCKESWPLDRAHRCDRPEAKFNPAILTYADWLNLTMSSLHLGIEVR